MPDEAATDWTKPALALSGGGFRATLFHCGALLRLNELGLLAQIERLSSVSGGAIIAGLLALKWAKLQFTKQADGRVVAANLEAEVIAPAQRFCGLSIDVPAILCGAANPMTTAADELARLYAEHLFGTATMQDLMQKPQFVFNATNIQTGRLVRIRKDYLADHMIGQYARPTVSLARAVAASSAFPPVLSPIIFEMNPADLVPGSLGRFGKDENYNTRLPLMDGGAYDNLGLETIDSFSTVLCSDAGAPFHFEHGFGVPYLSDALRALDIATDQARGVRKRWLIDTHGVGNPGGRCLALWDIDVDDGSSRHSLPPPPHPLLFDKTLCAQLAVMRTRLNVFSLIEQEQLINWGYASSDYMLRASPIAAAAVPPSGWPRPSQPLG
jgi:NTE family protein